MNGAVEPVAIRSGIVVALLTGLASPVLADCPAANRYSFLFASRPVTNLSYTGGPYSYTATNPAGQSIILHVNFAAYGLTTNVNASGVPLPQIGTAVNNGGSTNWLDVGGLFPSRTADITSNTRVIVTTFAFPMVVRDVQVTVADIDAANTDGWRDWIMFTGKNGAANYVPVLTTPYGQQNGGMLTGPTSTVRLGPTSTPLTVGVSEAVGIFINANTNPNGNVTVSVGQPVTTLEMRFGNYPLQSGESVTNANMFGINGVSFCPMPNLSVSKTSTAWSDPVSGTVNPKNIPGGDVIYTMTVSNADTSPVDLSTLALTDVLPANLTFYNGDIDDGGPLTTNFEFTPGTSGLTFGAANFTYSNNGGATYGYAPSAGYDAAVNALKFTPTGSMPANSAFTIKFRARIK